MDKIISSQFYNPETGLISATKLYKKLIKTHPEITMKQIKQWIDKQYTTQLNRPVRKPKHFSSIFSPSPRNNYQMDIIVYDRYEYNHYKYILCVIDVYSRYVSARAMTNRELKTIIANVKNIFTEMGEPKNLNCDNEFNKHAFNTLMQSMNVVVHYSKPNEINKNAIVERFNKTLAELLQRWRTATGKYDWQKVLPKIISNYNNTYHSTVKETPNDLFNNLTTTKQRHKVVDHVFTVGDKVRQKLVKRVFDKNDIIKYSKNIYIIRKIIKNKIYLTNSRNGEEINEFFKPYQLKLINEIQYKEPENDEKEIIEHEKTQKQRKVKKVINKEGVAENEQAIRRSKRERRPVNLLVDKKGQFIKY